jgi:hypothetical protein
MMNSSLRSSEWRKNQSSEAHIRKKSDAGGAPGGARTAGMEIAPTLKKKQQ